MIKLLCATLVLTGLLMQVTLAEEENNQINNKEDTVQYILSFWDYNDPAVSEERFVALAPQFMNADLALKAILKTQLARTYSLRHRFKEAHALLEEAGGLIESGQSDAKVFYLLEKGRTYNTAGDKEKALPMFVEAWELARLTGNDYLAVDAAHMVA
ncbi:MAG: hypothetical protein OEZ23_08865, partial [Gammaproteobacteria bacterium]|nr:hypothetical protein [Gammaproteobacteria bacterium]